jgi:hypothetical protein
LKKVVLLVQGEHVSVAAAAELCGGIKVLLYAGGIASALVRGRQEIQIRNIRDTITTRRLYQGEKVTIVSTVSGAFGGVLQEGHGFCECVSYSAGFGK